MTSAESDLPIVALVRYADSCEPAHKHSDCPFAVEQNGKLTCRIECREVIKSLLRRGRSEPTPRTQAFDAGQLLLSEPAGAPDTLWNTSSLLQIVVRAARSCPLRRDGSLELQRLVYATSALGALGCRGVDPEYLLRQGVGQAIKLALAIWIKKWSERSDDPRISWEYLDQWRAVFDEGSHEQPTANLYIGAAMTGPVSHRLDVWLESAPIEDVLLWRPPQSDIESSEPGSANPEAGPWRWIVERFTKTYLRTWSLLALKREYSFVRGTWLPDFSTTLLTERTLTQEEIATALADRAMVSEDVIDPSTMGAFVDQAVVLLADGQRAAAAALFDAARTIKPADLDAQNNYAFCILIDKPDQAQALFRDVLSRGAPDPAVTWCNVALAEFLLGHADAALDGCERASSAAHDRKSYLWQRRGDLWVVEYVDPRSWAIRFAAQLEQSAGIVGTWTERAEKLTLSEFRGTSEDPSSAETDGGDL